MKNIRGLMAVIVMMLAAPVQAQEKRLDYKQEQSLKDAVFYLDQAEGGAESLAKKVAPLKAGDASVQIQDVDQMLNTKKNIDKALVSADTRFKQLPVEHSKVKPEFDRVKAITESANSSEKKLNEVKESLSKVVNQGSGAGYKADFARLKEIAQMYNNPQVLNTHPQMAVDVCKQMTAVRDERKSIAEKYADLLKQSTPEAKDMNSVLRHFDDVFGQFESAAKTYAADAPARIDEDLGEAIKMGKDATTNKKPLFFGENGGVRQRLMWAQTKYDVLAAISPDGAATAASKKKIDATLEEVKQMKATLNDTIIQNNTPPAENYNGADKVQLIDMVKAKWAEAGVKGDVLKVGINSDGWKRDTRWEYMSRTWTKVDRSYIQGFVIVKVSDTLANIRFVNLVKDHQADDKITTHHFDDPKAELDVNRKILVSKVK